MPLKDSSGGLDQPPPAEGHVTDTLPPKTTAGQRQRRKKSGDGVDKKDPAKKPKTYEHDEHGDVSDEDFGEASPAQERASGSGLAARMADGLEPTASIADTDMDPAGEGPAARGGGERAGPAVGVAPTNAATGLSGSDAQTLNSLCAQMQAMQSLMQQVAASQQTLMDTTCAMRPILDQVSTQVVGHSARLEQHGANLRDLQARVGAIEASGIAGIGATRAAASGTGPHMPAPPSAHAPPPSPDARQRPPEVLHVPAQQFQPSYVEVRGWCSFDARRTAGLTRTECQSVVQQVRAHLAPEVAAHVGDISVRGVRNYAFKVAVRGGANIVAEVAGVANDLVASGTVQLPMGRPDRSMLRFNPERSQEAMDRQGAILRVLRATEGLIARREVEGQAQWAGKQARPNWRDSAVEVLGLPRGRLVVASAALGGDLTWNPEAFQVLGVQGPAALMAHAPAPSGHQ